MYKFGKIPARALQSFGVAGLLAEDAQVFYGALFSPRHVGRVSDLLTARLKPSRVDELRLRALLLYCVFEAAHTQMVAPDASAGADAPDGAFREPMVVECGIDSEKVVLGVAFTLEEGRELDLESLKEKIRNEGRKEPMEEMLSYLLLHAHRVVVRAQKSIRRYEVVAVLGLPDRIESSEYVGAHELEVVELDRAAVEAPNVKAYVELGDLDYPTLLREDSPVVQANAPATGEILVQSVREPEPPAESTEVRGEPREDDRNLFKMKSSEKDLQDQTVIRVKGKSDPAFDSTVVEVNGEREQEYLTKIAELERKVAQLEAVPAESPIAETRAEALVAEPESESEPEASAQDDFRGESRIKKILKRFFSPRAKDEQGAASENQDIAAVAGTQDSGDPSGEAELPPGLTPESAASTLIEQIQNGQLNQAIAKAQQEVKDLKKEPGGNRAARWMEGLMGDLVAEKARLHDMAKKLSASVRQKELEFRNKEQVFQLELYQRDESLKQKTHALGRAKEQIAQANLALERMRAMTQSASDEAHSKQKLSQTQRLLALAKDENAQLKSKIEELRLQLNAAQFASKARGGTSAELMNSQARLERTHRQMDELRKAHRELMDRVADSKKERSASQAVIEDLKKKFDAAQKASSHSSKEVERLIAENIELSREDLRLKGEIEKLNAELKVLRKTASGKPSGTPPAAA